MIDIRYSFQPILRDNEIHNNLKKRKRKNNKIDKVRLIQVHTDSLHNIEIFLSFIL